MTTAHVVRLWPTSRQLGRSSRRGYTLLELIAANFIVAAVLVPTTLLIRDCVKYSGRVELRSDMKVLCVSKLEQHCSLAAEKFVEWKEVGSFKEIDLPNLWYYVRREIPGSSAGLPTGLMEIRVVIWDDQDADGRLDSAEPFVDMQTRLAAPKS